MRRRLDFVNATGNSTSLGIVARCVEDALERAGVRRGGIWTRLAGRLPLPRRTPILALCLAHYLGRGAYEHPGLRRRRRRALLVGWEIEQLTRTLAEELAGADVLLGISRFNASAFRARFPGTPVIAAAICPPLPERATPDRERWGFGDVTTFLSVFDPVSGFDRKNPLDVLAAFREAFEGRRDVRLVFKVHGGFAKNPDEGDLEGEARRAASFLAECAADERVVLIDEYLPYADLLSLIASCDAYVSLARAEGLGLPVLEAMALGVPTVCTGYSGHLDFTDEASSLLVPYELVEIGDEASHYYHPDNFDVPPRWAQPDVSTAAAHFRTLADDPARRADLGAAGRRAARAYADACARSAWVDDLFDALESPAVAASHGVRHAAFRSVLVRDVGVWASHHRAVTRARLSLSARTKLGRLKRRLLAGGARVGRGRTEADAPTR